MGTATEMAATKWLSQRRGTSHKKQLSQLFFIQWTFLCCGGSSCCQGGIFIYLHNQSNLQWTQSEELLDKIPTQPHLLPKNTWWAPEKGLEDATVSTGTNFRTPTLVLQPMKQTLWSLKGRQQRPYCFLKCWWQNPLLAEPSGMYGLCGLTSHRWKQSATSAVILD